MKKATRGEGNPIELFKMLKGDASKVLHHYVSKLGKLISGHGIESLIFIPIPKMINAEECSYHYTVALISHASKVMLKILQSRLQLYLN